MSPQSKKIEIAIFLAAAAVITGIWAFNGYDDTWLYVTAILIMIPVSWFYFGKKNKD